MDEGLKTHFPARPACLERHQGKEFGGSLDRAELLFTQKSTKLAGAVAAGLPRRIFHLVIAPRGWRCLLGHDQSDQSVIFEDGIAPCDSKTLLGLGQRLRRHGQAWEYARTLPH